MWRPMWAFGLRRAEALVWSLLVFRSLDHAGHDDFLLISAAETSACIIKQCDTRLHGPMRAWSRGVSPLIGKLEIQICPGGVLIRRTPSRFAGQTGTERAVAQQLQDRTLTATHVAPRAYAVAHCISVWRMSSPASSAFRPHSRTSPKPASVITTTLRPHGRRTSGSLK